jgi:hypothetical protein
MVTIRIRDIVSSADTAEQGVVVFPHISCAFDSANHVIVSFDGINTATSSFVNTAIIPLLGKMNLDTLKQLAEAKAIAQRSPAFEGVEVMRGAFGGAQPKPAEDFVTLGVSTRLVARNSLGNEVVGALTRLLLAARPAIPARIPIANRIEAPAADKGAALPVHPGALAFLDGTPTCSTATRRKPMSFWRWPWRRMRSTP